MGWDTDGVICMMMTFLAGVIMVVHGTTLVSHGGIGVAGIDDENVYVSFLDLFCNYFASLWYK